jgi:predicted molibdopterin-dependent oxidoreductase YjgC
MQEKVNKLRVREHPVLGSLSEGKIIQITVDGKPLPAVEGEPILAALAAHGIRECRTTMHKGEPRWFYCGIGRCTDCVMIVDGIPNVRTCVTPVVDGMRVETQRGAGHWSVADD